MGIESLSYTDLATHKPLPARFSLKARIEALQAELNRLEVAAADYRADYERGRARAELLLAEFLKATAEATAAKESAARLEGELAALKVRRWWRRLAG